MAVTVVMVSRERKIGVHGVLVGSLVVMILVDNVAFLKLRDCQLCY